VTKENVSNQLSRHETWYQHLGPNPKDENDLYAENVSTDRGEVLIPHQFSKAEHPCIKQPTN